MVKMTSDRPLLVNGEAGTEFETDEQHAKELELKGFAVRVQGKGAAASLVSAEGGPSTDTTEASAPAPARSARRASNKAS
ncbi:hypothetical protein [Variovorax sp. UMC13]|uniref:hypothetical protein n=1 Tax=Variovorax sp. UMC13 TaxID=1862326 RepID=UPI0015FF6D78|nr:hypothetical protein [Variovorax sp. UMC13]